MSVRVLLADDHAMFRTGLSAVLTTQPDLDCVAEVADGQAAVHEVVRVRPDVAILDIRTPRLDGLRATEEILARADNRTKVVVLTTYDDDAYVYRALRAGASGFLLKSLPPEELIAAVRVAARGDALIDPSVTRRLIARFTDRIAPPTAPTDLDQLTARERQVFRLLAVAHSNAEIAALLGIGDETVKTHVSRILTKLNLRDRVHAVVYARLHGLIWLDRVGQPVLRLVGEPDQGSHPAQIRALHAYLRWRNNNTRHPDVLAAQCKERSRIRSAKGIGWSGRPLDAAA